MGLTIKTYNYSYSMLQRLRQSVLEIEGITVPILEFYNRTDITTEYPQFVCHCDCEGIYISKTSKQYQKYLKKWGADSQYFGDLEALKKEIKKLDKPMRDKLLDNPHILKSWVDFYNDAMSARKILEFH
jgi:hypothetical protein